MKRNQVFVAEDGTQFETSAECREHEAKVSIQILVGLTAVQVENAMDRSNVALSDAIERAGKIISARRRESGELRRTKKRMAAAPPMPEL